MLAYTEEYRAHAVGESCTAQRRHGCEHSVRQDSDSICQSQWGKSAVVYRHGIGPSLDGVDDPVVPRDECQRRRISPPLAPLEPTVDRASLIGWLNLAKSKKRKKKKERAEKRLVTFPRSTRTSRKTYSRAWQWNDWRWQASQCPQDDDAGRPRD